MNSFPANGRRVFRAVFIEMKMSYRMGFLIAINEKIRVNTEKKLTNDLKKIKSKLSKIMMGTYNGDQNKPIIIDEVEYRSAGEASKLLNISMTTIRWRVLSNNKKFEKYKYK